jgi:hypothetical protein
MLSKVGPEFIGILPFKMILRPVREAIDPYWRPAVLA